MQRRLARMNGGTAILKIGALTAVELFERRARAEKALRTLAGVVESGVVPGGGMSYIECIDSVNAARHSCSIPGQSFGVEVLARSLSSPFEQIVANHGGIHPPLALETSRRLGSGFGFDARTGNFVDMRSQGILDSARIVKGALQGAVSAASSLITTSVVILPAERTYQAKP
jgi:chaperonin GroEL